MKNYQEYFPYSKTILQHFRKPRNIGKIKNPDGTGEAGNILCGDIMKLYIKVKEDKKGKKRISDIKVQTFGCIVAIANSSMITEMARGRSLEEAIKISRDDILKKLGKIPALKIHCSVLAVDALHEAIYDYFVKNNLPIQVKLQKEHERIQQTLKMIEERHKEFVELEKEVLKR